MRMKASCLIFDIGSKIKFIINCYNYISTMVTFMCGYCDATLKKNQTEKHAFGRCRPASFICIDCHKTFQGE